MEELGGDGSVFTFLWCCLEESMERSELKLLEEASIQHSLDEGICVNYFRHQTINGFNSCPSK